MLISKMLYVFFFFMFRNSFTCAGSGLEQNCHDDHDCKGVVLKLFMLPNPSSLMQVLTEPLLKLKLKNVLKRVEHKI